MGFSQIKPSIRDLQQFISPNAGESSRLIQITETTGKNLSAKSSEFAVWEDEEIAALIIDLKTQDSLPYDYLKLATKELSCC